MFKYLKGDDFVNTSGYIRGYQAKNMKTEDFIKVVIETLNQEFKEIKEGIKLEKIHDKFVIKMQEYRITMSIELLDKLRGPYSIDRYILKELERQGFVFDRKRSQYIQYCFGNYLGAQII